MPWRERRRLRDMRDMRVVRDTRRTARTVRTASTLRLAAVLAATSIGAAALGACGESASGATLDRRVAQGDAERGKSAIMRYGCGSCHQIPGVTMARGVVGPPLTGWAQRRVIAGETENTPENLIVWITYPQAVEPGTDMPNMGVTDGDARDIAAYLYTLR